MSELFETEEVTRYIFDDDHYSRPDKKNQMLVRIKKNAVAPMVNSLGELESSVMLTTLLSNDDVLKIGNEHVAKERGEPLVAFVRFSNAVVIQNSLKTVHDKKGHALHAAIKEWPTSKEDWMEKADDLAKAITANSAKDFKEV